MDALNHNKSRKALGHHDFNSLPTRGIRRSKDLSTKPVINSDIYFQTKTLLYADHQKPINYFPNQSFRNLNVKVFPTNSMDSLNSFNEPDIVAALDQIASSMGMTDEKVLLTSNDPINYILKTTSFSDKISIYKRSPSNNYCDDRRVQSFVTEPSVTKPFVKNQTAMPVTPIMRKKESSFRKIIQKFSPKAVRRTKSSPSTILVNSVIDATIEEEKIFESNSNKQMTVPNVTDSSVSDKVSDEIKYQSLPTDISVNKEKDLTVLSDHSKRLLNSITIGIVEDPKAMFNTISKNLSSQNKQELNGECHQTFMEGSDNSSIILSSETESPEHCATNSQKSLSSIPQSASYIQISLSAFGYGPNPTLRRSPTYINHRTVIRDTEGEDIKMPNERGDR